MLDNEFFECVEFTEKKQEISLVTKLKQNFCQDFWKKNFSILRKNGSNYGRYIIEELNYY